MSYLNFPDIPKYIKTDDPPHCPEHDKPMRLVCPRKGDKWKHFWGCSKYPECEWSYSIDDEGNYYERNFGFDPYDYGYGWEAWY